MENLINKPNISIDQYVLPVPTVKGRCSLFELEDAGDNQT